MVMHARKYPRLNDGYFERGQAHSYEDKNPSKGRSSKYDSKESPGYRGHRDDSPSRPSPRYQNKAAYAEREKDRIARLSSSSSPGDKRSTNHHRLSSSSSSHKNGKGRNDHRGGGGGNTGGDYKSEMQKTAIHVCGDWSEHRSSSGKKYYYNCETQVSQWEKPKDWLEPPSSKLDVGRRDGRDKSGSKGHGDDRSHKHSSGDKYSSRYDSRGYDKHRTQSSSSSHHKVAAGQTNSTTTPSSSSKSKDSHSYDRYSTADRQDKSGGASGGGRYVNCSTPSRGGGHNSVSSSAVNSNSASSGEQRSSGGQRRSSVHVLSRTALHDERRERTSDMSAGGGAEDMEISPGTPTEEDMGEKLQQQAAAAAAGQQGGANAILATVSALPSLLHQLGDANSLRGRLPSIDSQQLTQQAISTLQKLQEALMAQQRQQQQQLVQLLQQQLTTQQQQAPTTPTSASTATAGSGHGALATTPTATTPLTVQTTPHGQQNGSQSPAESEGTPLQSPELHLPGGGEGAAAGDSLRPQYIGTREQSPTSEHGRNNASRRGSPAPMSGLKKAETVTLPPQLANYYDEGLITHVTPWIEDGRSLERAADRFSEDAHSIGGLGSTQVSCDLKRARSWVRVSEITSTLQEQRILFLRQQVKDLENLRSQNTFMPATAASSVASNATHTPTSTLHNTDT